MSEGFDLGRLTVPTHSAIRIETASGTVIYLDPFNLTSAEAAHDADAVLVTHAHFDHYSPEDIARVANEGTVLVAPASMADEADAFDGRACLMIAGDRLEIPGTGVGVEAVPAYNVAPERLGMHPRENGWLGYVLEIDGARVYVSGDTDQNPDNESVDCDVALVPIGGTYTCDPVQAAAFVNALRPAVAIPTHYGTVVGTQGDFDAFAAAVDPAISVVKKLER